MRCVKWIVAGTMLVAITATVATLPAASPAAPVKGRLMGTALGKFIGGQVGRLMVLREELNITEEQRAKVREVLKSHRDEIAPAAKAVWEKRTALRDAVLDDGTNEKAIREAADALGKAAGDAAVVAAKVAREVRPILTDEQQAKIRATRTECREDTAEFFEKLMNR